MRYLKSGFLLGILKCLVVKSINERLEQMWKFLSWCSFYCSVDLKSKRTLELTYEWKNLIFFYFFFLYFWKIRRCSLWCWSWGNFVVAELYLPVGFFCILKSLSERLIPLTVLRKMGGVSLNDYSGTWERRDNGCFQDWILRTKFEQKSTSVGSFYWQADLLFSKQFRIVNITLTWSILSSNFWFILDSGRK